MTQISPPNSEDQDNNPDSVSKTQIKKNLLEIKALGKRLLELKPEILNTLPLSDRLHDALNEGRRIKSNNARKRHLGFIGKLMQQQDLEAITTVLNRLDSHHQEHTDFFHQLESWRNRLLEDGDPQALSEFLSLYPHADVQYMRQMIRNAQKERKADKPPASSRKLFRYLREISEAIR